MVKNSSRTVMIYIYSEEKRREEKRYLIVRVSVDTIHCLAMKEKSSKRKRRGGDFVRFAPNKVLRNSEPLDPPFPRNWNSQR